jgi:hypothetical protein
MTTPIHITPDCNDGYNYNPESSCPLCGDGFEVPVWGLHEEDVLAYPFLTERIILELLIRSGVELRG